jgi:hypothetical protein
VSAGECAAAGRAREGGGAPSPHCRRAAALLWALVDGQWLSPSLRHAGQLGASQHGSGLTRGAVFPARLLCR